MTEIDQNKVREEVKANAKARLEDTLKAIEKFDAMLKAKEDEAETQAFEKKNEEAMQKLNQLQERMQKLAEQGVELPSFTEVLKSEGSGFELKTPEDKEMEKQVTKTKVPLANIKTEKKEGGNKLWKAISMQAYNFSLLGYNIDQKVAEYKTNKDPTKGIIGNLRKSWKDPNDPTNTGGIAISVFALAGGLMVISSPAGFVAVGIGLSGIAMIGYAGITRNKGQEMVQIEKPKQKQAEIEKEKEELHKQVKESLGIPEKKGSLFSKVKDRFGVIDPAEAKKEEPKAHPTIPTHAAGQQKESPIESEMLFCPQCGSDTPVGWKFCRKCRSQLEVS